MATQTAITPFTGKPGNIIGYRRNEKYFLRSVPEKVGHVTIYAQTFTLAGNATHLKIPIYNDTAFLIFSFSAEVSLARSDR
jgi:hypothetical protein